MIDQESKPKDNEGQLDDQLLEHFFAFLVP